jgi:hypothetical protein
VASNPGRTTFDAMNSCNSRRLARIKIRVPIETITGLYLGTVQLLCFYSIDCLNGSSGRQPDTANRIVFTLL